LQSCVVDSFDDIFENVAKSVAFRCLKRGLGFSESEIVGFVRL